jgi:hypothetical protein
LGAGRIEPVRTRAPVRRRWTPLRGDRLFFYAEWSRFGLAGIFKSGSTALTLTPRRHRLNPSVAARRSRS